MGDVAEEMRQFDVDALNKLPNTHAFLDASEHFNGEQSFVVRRLVRQRIVLGDMSTFELWKLDKSILSLLMIRHSNPMILGG